MVPAQTQQQDHEGRADAAHTPPPGVLRLRAREGDKNHHGPRSPVYREGK